MLLSLSVVELLFLQALLLSEDIALRPESRVVSLDRCVVCPPVSLSWLFLACRECREEEDESDRRDEDMGWTRGL